MRDRLLSSLRTPDPASHPDQQMVRATQGIEGPRTYIGLSKEQEVLTKGKPSNGVYFLNIETGLKEQWIVDHWEVIGQVFIGDINLSDTKFAPKETPVPYGYPGGGGSVVAVAPRGPNDPPILQPVAPIDQPVNIDIVQTTDNTGFNGNILAGVTQLIFSFNMPNPTLGAAPFDNWAVIMVPAFHATPAAGGQVRHIVTVDGVVVDDTTLPVDNADLSPIEQWSSAYAISPGSLITVEIEAITATVSVVAVIAVCKMMYNAV